jgi:hypothetical protein
MSKKFTASRKMELFQQDAFFCNKLVERNKSKISVDLFEEMDLQQDEENGYLSDVSLE